MKALIIKIYWIITIISQLLLLIVIFRNIPYESHVDILLITFGGVIIPFSWLWILQITNIMKTNDAIDKAFKEADERSKEFDKALNALRRIALRKMGVTREEYEKEYEKS